MKDYTHFLTAIPGEAARIASLAREEQHLDPASFARIRLGYKFDAQQIKVLTSTAKRGILNCSRQWGKSTVTAAKAVHRAYTRAGSLVLVSSPSERQSAEFLLKASGMVRTLGIPVRGDGKNSVSLLFPNKSRIVGLPGTDDTIRGFSAASLIVIDEASRVPDVVYEALRPMLAVLDGDLWLMSTPCGQRGFFYNAWRDETEKWAKFQVPATECKRIKAKFLDGERAALDAAKFSQEYMCEFTGTDLAVFDRAMVEAAIDDSYRELDIQQGW
jgi:hypothetical protein